MSLALLVAAALFEGIIANAYGPYTLYTPSSDSPSYGALSPIAIQLKYSGANNNKMYATFEQTTSGIPVFPVYESIDNGSFRCWQVTIRNLCSVFDEI